jgi:hypothetical protein
VTETNGNGGFWRESGARWTPVWAMPNVTLDETIETTCVALAPYGDDRLHEFARGHPTMKTFLNAFRNEFGTPIRPTTGMVREDAPHNVRTVAAFGSFRDAICMSAVIFGQGMTLTAGSRISGAPSRKARGARSGNCACSPRSRRVMLGSRFPRAGPVRAYGCLGLRLTAHRRHARRTEEPRRPPDRLSVAQPNRVSDIIPLISGKCTR